MKKHYSTYLFLFFVFQQNIIAEHEIRNISCAAQDPEDLSTFAYITKDLKSSHHYCHVFTAFDVVSAEALIKGSLRLKAIFYFPLVSHFSFFFFRTWPMKSSWRLVKHSKWPTSWPCRPGRVVTDRPRSQKALTANPTNPSPSPELTSANQWVKT